MKKIVKKTISTISILAVICFVLMLVCNQIVVNDAEGRAFFGISKKHKDTVVVNGKEHYFHHVEVIKDVKYKED